MALCEYDDQFVPALTPCSAASLRLKKMWLPRMERSVVLPVASRIVAGTRDNGNVLSAMESATTQIALGFISAAALNDRK